MQKFLTNQAAASSSSSSDVKVPMDPGVGRRVKGTIYKTKNGLRRWNGLQFNHTAYLCQVCGKSFSHPGARNIHERTHTGERPYKCRHEGCDNTFARSWHRDSHERTHTGEKPYKCRHEGCDKAFAQTTHRNTHERTHTGSKPYKCRIEGCDKAFAQSSSRDSHERTHTGEKPYRCRHKGCDKAFAQTCGRNIHERTHTGEKKYKCKYPNCGKTFIRNYELIIHNRVHTGDKPFKCTHEGCGKAFTQSISLNLHLSSVHDIGVKWHVCDADPDHCTFQAKTNSNLQAHIRCMHARVYAQRKQEQEERVRKALLAGEWQEYRLSETMPPVGFFKREKRIDFNCAKKAQPGALATARNDAKIDFVLGMSDGYIFLEVDEHQHKHGYYNESLSCDMKRMSNVMESLAVETDFNVPNIYWLRYNPHAHRVDGKLVKVSKNEREKRLLAWLKDFEFTRPLGIGYSFYDYSTDEGLEVLGHDEYNPQYAELVDNLKALDDDEESDDEEGDDDEMVCTPCV